MFKFSQIVQKQIDKNYLCEWFFPLFCIFYLNPPPKQLRSAALNCQMEVTETAWSLQNTRSVHCLLSLSKRERRRRTERHIFKVYEEPFSL